jgi:hypothetical protein
LKYKAEDMDSVTSPLRPPKTKEKHGKHVVSGPIEDENEDLDRCSYELERDKRVAKIKEIMKPMEQAALSL